jgi:uncharacterized membrane protein YdfJ with MMPL/SSD domain
MLLLFQDGLGRSLLGAADMGSIVSEISPFLVVIFFGLSMDYEVLVLSRDREVRDRGLPSERAVARQAERESVDAWRRSDGGMVVAPGFGLGGTSWPRRNLRSAA